MRIMECNHLLQLYEFKIRKICSVRHSTDHRVKPAMKRTQLYLDEERVRLLETLSHQKGASASDLVQTSLSRHYMPERDIDKVELARHLAGIWKSRKEFQDIDASIRNLRKNGRLKNCFLPR